MKSTRCTCIEFQPYGIMNNDGDGFCVACSGEVYCRCAGKSVNGICTECTGRKEVCREDVYDYYKIQLENSIPTISFEKN